ncbi:MAG: hypothetical protein COU47_03230 [Candidatus Niyogibacteria bacterium CG10_big_fil_rev_8_21_14_0_10_46_36]|uniref:Uncharacterized protein n=1 Tax=Candidatus Niyogibacteria bacterium CG10_big_fil_rev_8_21_14_0_10_46_36 TaxID=1974726 RepID=A0A2H0TCS5_9BACT|nr:MAG: hypothetical protein COU47_03230 [Candidatus Niyogibacteria bacterium CG10_big_fil_rev_8_21_14_0_10_46_36]
MKKILIIAVIIVGAAGLFFWKGPSPKAGYTALAPDTIGGEGVLYTYTIKGESNGGGALSLSFTDDGNYSLINIALDLNDSGAYEDDEWVAENQISYVQRGTDNNFAVDLPEGELPSTITGIAAFSAEPMTEGWWDGENTRTITITTESFELNDILGLDVPGNGPGVYRGYADGFSARMPVAYAQTFPTVNVDSQLNIGDLRQSNMECAPTSITNNLTGLAGANGRNDLPSAETMVDQLKSDLKFGDEGVAGVLDKNYIAGKNAFMRRYNLPIVTTEISNPSIEDIANAIQSGAVVEMDLAFIEVTPQGNNHVASHVVTLTGVSSNGSSATLRGRDSATPTGNESWQFFPKRAGQPSSQMHYPMWRKGATVINKIYIQRYVSVDDAVAAGVLPQGVVGSTYPVDMLVIGGKYYPKDQFTVGNNPEDACGAPHYHKHTTAYGLQSKTSIAIVQANDPNPNSCGFGKVSDVPTETVRLTWEQQQAIAGALLTP